MAHASVQQSEDFMDVSQAQINQSGVHYLPRPVLLQGAQVDASHPTTEAENGCQLREVSFLCPVGWWR